MLKRVGNRFNAQELWQKDHDHFLHPWTHFDSFKKEGSLIIAEAEGCYITDVNGKRYLDGLGGMWCVNVGYGRNEMAEAMAEQARLLPYANAFVDMSNAPAAELAAKLAEIAPGNLNRVAFSTSGSCANDTAIRLAHFYHARRGEPTRKNIISRHNSYHGSTYLAMSVGNRVGDRTPEFHYITDFIHHLSAPYPYRRPEGMSEDRFTDHLVDEFKAKIRELGAENIAAFIAEPIQGSGGVVVPPRDYLRRMAEVAKENGILFIADEVVTGFGRLGHWFASQDVFGVEPDMIVSAKGLTSGYLPLGATIFSDDIYEAISQPGHDVWFAHGFTYSGHPVCCAVANKNIEIIEREGLLDHARQVGDHFETRLRELSDLRLVGDVRGKRLMMCVEYVADKQTKAHLPEEINISKRISSLCGERGLLVRPLGHLDVMSPPLTLSLKQADFLVDTLRGAIEEVTRDLVKGGLLPALPRPFQRGGN
ncbi:MAG: aminotransferase [Rhizobiales bacterium]|nr:aminotransferase [Hyphomicrobiales bacterium]MBI3674652.1 aminotransferase [Hyphomicrobiales bacterium]